MEPMGIFDKGVKKTNLNFFQKLGRAITGKSKVDEDVLDALEEALLSSDMGVDTTLKLIGPGPCSNCGHRASRTPHYVQGRA